MIPFILLLILMALIASTVFMIRYAIQHPVSEDETLMFPIDVEEIGAIERDLVKLRSVIIVADHVEDPDSNLREAVIDNLREDIEYLFLVSPSNYKQDVESYHGYFEALLTIAKSHGPKDGYMSLGTCNIESLSHEWGDFPYVFYVFEKENGTGEILQNVLGYRGNEIREGIASRYARVKGIDGFTIVRQVLSAAGRMDLMTPREAFIRDNLYRLPLKNTQSIAKEDFA